MKHRIYFLILLFTFSCNQNNRTDTILKSELNEKPDQTQTDTVADLELTKDTNECIFDQLTQTDDFLKNIKEFNGYQWDYNTRTATIILQNQDTLIITRGGCDHFCVSAKFRLYNSKTDYSDLNNVYNKILWISELLSSEFSYKEIKTEIDSNTTRIENYDNMDIIYFSSEYLQDNHYEITRKIKKDLTEITLSYYIN